MPFLLLARFPGRWTSLLSALLRCLGNLKGRMKTGKSEKMRSVISLSPPPRRHRGRANSKAKVEQKDGSNSSISIAASSALIS